MWQKKQERVLVHSNKGYSLISIELFKRLEEKINFECFYATYNKEYFLSSIEALYFYDFTIPKIKKIIEFNGDYWHANPEFYNENEILKLPGQEILVKDLWQKDAKKIEFARSKGFDVLVIWEKDYCNDKEGTINKCLGFLNGNNQ